jgi:hypothetical protein
MLTLQFQKATQVAASYRAAFTFAFLITVAVPSIAQVLSGTYSRQDRMNDTRQFTFGKERFSEKLVGEEGETFGRGTFRVDSGKLFLTYEKLIDSNASTFTMRVFNTVEQGAIVNLKVLSKDPDSKNVMAGVANLDGNTIASFTADPLGKVNVYVVDDKTVGFLTVVRPFYNKLSIPMDFLRKKATEVEVMLKPQNGKYYIEPHIDVYDLQLDGTKFKIVSPQNSVEIYEKVD